MPQPSSGDVHVDRRLTDISSAFIADDAGWVAGRVFETLPVDKRSDKILKYDREDWFRDEMQKRAPATESAGTGFSVSDDTYFADKWALHQDIADDIVDNQDEPMDLRNDATERLSQLALLRKEKAFATNFMTTGVWGKDFTPSTTWESDSGSPIDDISGEMETVIKKVGPNFKPNRLVLSLDVFNELRNHTSFTDRIKHTSRDSVTTDMMAELIDIPEIGEPLEVMVAAGVENTAAEGASISMDFIHKKDALLVYSESNPSRLRPSGGYNFAWQGMFGAGREGNRMKRFRMEELDAERVEIEMAFDMHVLESELGVFLNNVIA